MPKEDEIRLRHLLATAREARSFVKGKPRRALDGNRMLALALVMDIEIIGEAAAKVSRETQAMHADIPWPDVGRYDPREGGDRPRWEQRSRTTQEQLPDACERLSQNHAPAFTAVFSIYRCGV